MKFTHNLVCKIPKRVHAHAHTHIHTHTHTRTCIHTNTHTNAHTHIYKHTHTYEHTHTHVQWYPDGFDERPEANRCLFLLDFPAIFVEKANRADLIVTMTHTHTHTHTRHYSFPTEYVPKAYKSGIKVHLI